MLIIQFKGLSLWYLMVLKDLSHRSNITNNSVSLPSHPNILLIFFQRLRWVMLAVMASPSPGGALGTAGWVGCRSCGGHGIYPAWF
jgi:hypothetical protein